MSTGTLPRPRRTRGPGTGDEPMTGHSSPRGPTGHALSTVFDDTVENLAHPTASSNPASQVMAGLSPISRSGPRRTGLALGGVLGPSSRRCRAACGSRVGRRGRDLERVIGRGGAVWPAVCDGVVDGGTRVHGLCEVLAQLLCVPVDLRVGEDDGGLLAKTLARSLAWSRRSCSVSRGSARPS